jgi:hypothetical protein
MESGLEVLKLPSYPSSTLLTIRLTVATDTPSSAAISRILDLPLAWALNARSSRCLCDHNKQSEAIFVTLKDRLAPGSSISKGWVMRRKVSAPG